MPATVEEHVGPFNGVERNDDYDITLHYSDSPDRTFVGLKVNVTWEFEHRTCYYVGNGQAGTLAEVAGSSVIEGDYVDYKVDSLFETEFSPFGQFMEAYCDTV